MCDLCKAEDELSSRLYRTTLENTEPGHNKRYTLFIEEVKGGFQVMAQYGPIGKWVKSTVKSAGPHTIAEARMILEDILNKKVRSRGYRMRLCARSS